MFFKCTEQVFLFFYSFLLYMFGLDLFFFSFCCPKIEGEIMFSFCSKEKKSVSIPKVGVGGDAEMYF